MSIIGEKTYLTCIKKSSLEILRTWRNSEDIKQYTREYREISEEMQSQWFEKQIHNKSQLNFEIYSNDNNCLIGQCSLANINWTYRSAEFGIYIAVSNLRGYGSDALKALIKHGFYELNLHRIYGEVYSNNLRALSAFYKIGFVKECVLRKAKFMNGDYCDIICVSMLEDEWREKYGK